MFENIPQNALEIIKKLEYNGHKAYIVGGCVRDILMGITPHDYDICTSALPHQVKTCLCDMRIEDTGIKHGTVSVIIPNDEFSPYEITTFRSDGTYSDGRHPDNINFINDIKADLARRDFTINAIAYNPNSGIVDAFGGKTDIDNRIIKCVGEPSKRFNEDALRILRAVRFEATTGFDIEPATFSAMLECTPKLKNVSAERIETELIKTLNGKYAYNAVNKSIDVIKFIIPEIKGMDAFKTACDMQADTYVRLATLLESTTEQQAHSRLKTLKTDGETLSIVTELIAYKDIEVEWNKPFLRRLISKHGKQQTRRLMCFLRCCGVNTDKQTAMIDEILNTESCFNIKDLAINGNDIEKLGVKSGPEIGIILKQLLNDVFDEKITNEHQALIKAAMSLICNTK